MKAGKKKIHMVLFIMLLKSVDESLVQGHLNQIIQIFLFFVDKKPNSVRSERNILRPIRVTHCLPSLQWTEAIAGTTTQVWVQRGKSRSDFLQWRWAWVHLEHQKRSSFHDPPQLHQAWVFITSPWTKIVQELGGKLKSFHVLDVSQNGWIE